MRCVVCVATGPSGVLAPSVTVLGPSSLRLSWYPPTRPNGVLESYTVKLPLPRYTVYNVSQLTLTVTQLSAFTSYNVTITACSGLGNLFIIVAYYFSAYDILSSLCHQLK